MSDSAQATVPPFGRQALDPDRLVARFAVGAGFGPPVLAIERTDDDHRYLLAIEETPAPDVIAVIEVDQAGAYASHHCGGRRLDPDKVARWARMAGWKILTHRRRTASAATPRPAQTNSAPGLPGTGSYCVRVWPDLLNEPGGWLR